MRNKRLLILTGLFLVSMLCSAWGESDEEMDERGHDPFNLPKKKILKNSGIPQYQGQWRLTGIISTSSGANLAILNERLVSEGDKVVGGRVERIDSDRIILKGNFGVKELRILPFTSDGESPEQ